jgi:DNA-binding NarL/FixJ family response regulator
LIAPSVTKRLIAQFARQSPSGRRPPSLSGVTERESEVLTLVARGLSNMEIAERLSVSLATANTHVAAAVQARRAGPGAAGDRRVRDRPRQARLVATAPA